jgi:carboxymethylenebutenolidase
LKTIKRILLGLAAIILILVLILLASIGIDYVLGRDRLAALTNTTIPGDEGPHVAAYVARPAGSGPFPAVIMIHEFFGLNESIVGKADGLAEAGFLVIAPDTFRGSTTAWIPRAIFQVITTNSEQVNQDLDAVYAWAAAQPDIDPGRIGVLGFCYGGRASLTYSLHNPRLAATVIFYGSPETDPGVLQALPGPVLGIFGGADTSIPLEETRLAF